MASRELGHAVAEQRGEHRVAATLDEHGVEGGDGLVGEAERRAGQDARVGQGDDEEHGAPAEVGREGTRSGQGSVFGGHLRGASVLATQTYLKVVD
ncbi:hypothetical protein [Nannocystis pusilla]|uniref:hypothetical protein n=1 Tax=Nannocystis pusilla TaxID=889268 RepID=UPI003B815E82